MFSLDFKIKIDRILFGALAYILDRMAFFLGRFLNINHSITKENVKNVVIAKYLGLGSIVRSQVIIEDIKTVFPNAKIYYLTSKKNKAIFDIIRNVDKVFTIDDAGIISMAFSTFNLIKNLLKIKVDVFMDLEVYSRYSTCISIMSCARNRYGFFRHDIHWHIGVYTHMLYFNNQKNISEIYLQLSKYLTRSDNNYKSLPSFNFREDNKKEVEDYFLKNLKRKEKDLYIGINANASELALERRYPPAYFTELIENLLNIKNVYIFLIGSPSERQYLEEEIYNKLNAKNRDKVFLTAGLFSLNGSIYLLSKFDLFITTDSGPLHFAYAQNINIISIWGTGSYWHYGYMNYDKEYFLMANIYCSPCLYLTVKPPCRGHNICLQKIYPKIIYDKVIEHFKIKDKVDYIEIVDKSADDGYYLGSIKSFGEKV